MLSPVYSKSVNPVEMWISMAEKAYAKAVGEFLIEYSNLERVVHSDIERFKI